MPQKKRGGQGFTLIEILIAVGVVAVISIVVVFLVNPLELLRRARDSDRFTDLATINKAISLYAVEGTFFGLASTVYVSIPDASSTCSNLDLPALDPPWVYGCSSSENHRKVDGAGWIPINFASLSIKTPLTRLPVDPVNSADQGLYYTYVGGSWKITARLEAQKNIEGMEKDGGNDDLRFEKGTDLTLGPPPLSSPVITGISPTSSPSTASADILSITGSNFQSGATVKLTKSNQYDISCSGFTFTSSSTLSNGTCPITGAATGAWSVKMTNPDTRSGIFTNGFTVTSGGGGDTSAPSPNPMTFASPFPTSITTSSIAMNANSGATDASPPIEYLFIFTACTSNGGNGGSSSTAWSTNATHTDSGLDVNKCYAYQVQARDSASSTNTGTTSASSSAYTAANVPGAPTIGSPTTSTLAIAINQNSNPSNTQFAVQVTSTVADSSWNGFWVDSNGASSSIAVWTTNLTNATATKLLSNTTYAFTVVAKNGDSIQTSQSATGSSTTSAAGADSDPPSPNPMTFASPFTTSTSITTSSITINATSGATDASPPIEYFFTFTACTSNGGNGGSSSTAWSTNATHTDSGLDVNKCYAYQVQARDSATSTNTGTASASSSAYTAANVPGALNFGGSPTTSTIPLDANGFNENGNPTSNPSTQFALYVTSTSPTDSRWQGFYVDSTFSGTSTSEIWMSDGTFDFKTISNLTPETTYTFKVKARNNGTPQVETAFGPTAATTTLAISGDVTFDTSSSGANAEGGECTGSSAWDHTEVCVNVPSGTPTGSASTTVTSDSSNATSSNASSFTVP